MASESVNRSVRTCWQCQAVRWQQASTRLLRTGRGGENKHGRVEPVQPANSVLEFDCVTKRLFRVGNATTRFADVSGFVHQFQIDWQIMLQQFLNFAKRFAHRFCSGLDERVTTSQLQRNFTRQPQPPHPCRWSTQWTGRLRQYRQSEVLRLERDERPFLL